MASHKHYHFPLERFVIEPVPYDGKVFKPLCKVCGKPFTPRTGHNDSCCSREHQLVLFEMRSRPARESWAA